MQIFVSQASFHCACTEGIDQILCMFVSCLVCFHAFMQGEQLVSGGQVTQF